MILTAFLVDRENVVEVNGKASEVFKLLEEKGYKLENKHLNRNVLMSGSNNNSFFFIPIRKDVILSSILKELKDIYFFLKEERDKKKNYKLIKKGGKRAIIDDNNLLFRISDSQPKLYIKDNSFEVVKDGLSFDKAYTLNKQILLEQILKERSK